jgi:hypothetical protein
MISRCLKVNNNGTQFNLSLSVRQEVLRLVLEARVGGHKKSGQVTNRTPKTGCLSNISHAGRKKELLTKSC